MRGFGLADLDGCTAGGGSGGLEKNPIKGDDEEAGNVCEKRTVEADAYK